jgi:hypothetical protein
VLLCPPALIWHVGVQRCVRKQALLGLVRRLRRQCGVSYCVLLCGAVSRSVVVYIYACAALGDAELHRAVCVHGLCLVVFGSDVRLCSC